MVESYCSWLLLESTDSVRDSQEFLYVVLAELIGLWITFSSTVIHRNFFFTATRGTCFDPSLN